MGGPHARNVDQLDVDEILVEQTVAGRRKPGVQLNRAERWAAIREMHRLNYSDALIASHLGQPERTVVRERQLLRLPGVPPEHMVRIQDFYLMGAPPNTEKKEHVVDRVTLPGSRPVEDVELPEPIGKAVNDWLAPLLNGPDKQVAKKAEKAHLAFTDVLVAVERRSKRFALEAQIAEREEELRRLKAELTGKVVKRPVPAAALEHRCEVCKKEIVRTPGTRGPWPKRCAEHRS